MKKITEIVDNNTGEIITILKNEKHADILRDIFRKEDNWNCRTHVTREYCYE